MKIVYTAPNRGHHYRYANSFNNANCLHAFVCGFPRFSSRAKDPNLGEKLYHADFVQTLYLLSLKVSLPTKFSRWLAFLSKIEQDNACKAFMNECDIFIYYNGSGLNTTRYSKSRGIITIVEAVNSHVEYQEEILEKEYHRLGLPWQPFPKKEKARRLKEYEEADYILLPSEFVKRSFIEKGFPEKKLLKVPYGFESLKSSTKSPDQKLDNDTFTILYVGAISVRKGVRYLIEAFNKLNKPNKKLLIVGPNSNDGALNGITFNSDIEFTGVLKGSQLAKAYSSADVFCLPSIEEGLALVLGEALSYGLPIIATCNTGAEDIIEDGKEGYIVPIKNSEAIFDKLQFFADNPSSLTKIRENSFLKSKKLDGWDETGKNLLNTLHKVYMDKKYTSTFVNN